MEPGLLLRAVLNRFQGAKDRALGEGGLWGYDSDKIVAKQTNKQKTLKEPGGKASWSSLWPVLSSWKRTLVTQLAVPVFKKDARMRRSWSLIPRFRHPSRSGYIPVEEA